MTDPAKDTFFFEQRSVRSAPKRFKKALEDLPQDLRYAHLNPRVAAYLASKEKERIAEEISEELKTEGLLPEINQKVSMIKNRLDTYLATVDVQRRAYQDLKSESQIVLVNLAKVLYLFEGLQPTLPKTLEGKITETWKELTRNVGNIEREWQIPLNEEQYFIHKQHQEFYAVTESDRDSVAKSLSVHGSPSDNLEDGEGLRRKKGGRNLGLANISERGEAKTEERNSSLVPQDSNGNLIPPLRRDQSRQSFSKATKRRTSRPNSSQGSPSSDAARGGGSHREQPSFWSVIQFQLSSKVCEEKGWIKCLDKNQEPDEDEVLRSILHRLQISLKQQRQQAMLNQEAANDSPVIRRFYGDSQNDQIKKYKHGNQTGTINRVMSSVMKGKNPPIPEMQNHETTSTKRLFMSSTTDGSLTALYPSGNTAMITSRNTNDKAGLYTFVYDDNPTGDQNMLACFTPSGRGCCYHSNGVVRFLATDEGGTIADEGGVITRRWTWPQGPGRLKEPIFLQLNAHFSLKCAGLGCTSLTFSCQKETHHVQLGPLLTLEKEETSPSLLSNYHFSSATAKELLRPSKFRGQFKKSRASRQRIRSPSLTTDFQKIIDFPEPTENDVDSEKSLLVLQRKAKNLVDDWMEHYRIALHIVSPTLKMVKEKQISAASRLVNSAKVTHTAGQVYLIDRESTKIPSPDIGSRVPSAPAGLNADRVYVSVNQINPTNLVTHGKGETSAVKFNEQQSDDSVPFSFTPTSCPPFPPVSSKPTSRTKSAPHRLFLTASESPEAVEGISPDASPCPSALREGLLTGNHGYCKCSRHRIPLITDVEFDEFVFGGYCKDQMLIICVVSSLFPDSTPSQKMLEKLHADKNKNRTRPCFQSKQDAFRLFQYDVATAADYCAHSQPMLHRRHNILPGMFLMYRGSQLVFCDHIFNGYGNEQKDFQKQVLQTSKTANKGSCLPRDFRFCPIRGRHGQRSGWGGEIGGAGVNRHGNAGLTPIEDDMNIGSAESSESDFPRHHISDVIPNYNVSIENSLPTIHENKSILQRLPLLPETNDCKSCTAIRTS